MSTLGPHDNLFQLEGRGDLAALLAEIEAALQRADSLGLSRVAVDLNSAREQLKSVMAGSKDSSD
jgi:hypothetical protein